MMMLLLTGVKFIKTIDIFRYHTKFHHIRMSKSKVILFKFQYQNERKRKSGEKMLWITKRGNKRLQIGAGFGDYKLGQEGLQIGASLGISNRGKKITSRGLSNDFIYCSL